jgi:hypothetical protein
VPPIALFRDNTAAFVPDLPAEAKVLITESPEGGWGINGHANTGADIDRGGAPRAGGGVADRVECTGHCGPSVE